MNEIDVLSNRVLIERIEADSETPGGIILPDASKEIPQMGKVIRVGPGKLLDNGVYRKMPVQKFDMVLFTSYAGAEVKVNGKEYLVLREDDIIAIVKQ